MTLDNKVNMPYLFMHMHVLQSLQHGLLLQLSVCAGGVNTKDGGDCCYSS